MRNYFKIPVSAAAMALVLAASSLFTVSAAQAEAKIAVVNIAKIISDSPQAKEARSAMDAAFANRRKTLEAEQNKLREEAEKIKRDADVVSEDEAKRMREQWLQRQKAHVEKMSQYNQDVQAKEKAELEKLRDSIVQIVERVAKNRGYDLVLSDGIVYAADAVNLTDTILAEMNKP